MLRRMKVARPIAWVVTLAMVVVLSTNCLTAEDMTPEQKACCAAMAHDCGAMAIEQGCCTGEASFSESLAAMTPIAYSAPPAAALVAVFEGVNPLSSPAGLFRSASRLPVKPPGIPTYLLVSTFRI